MTYKPTIMQYERNIDNAIIKSQNSLKGRYV